MINKFFKKIPLKYTQSPQLHKNGILNYSPQKLIFNVINSKWERERKWTIVVAIELVENRLSSPTNLKVNIKSTTKIFL